MLKNPVKIVPIRLCFLYNSCGNETNHCKVNEKLVSHISTAYIIVNKQSTVDVVPFEDTPSEIINALSDALKDVFPSFSNSQPSDIL
jgi:hypothetical protein